jgi:hypothetical protein
VLCIQFLTAAQAQGTAAALEEASIQQWLSQNTSAYLFLGELDKEHTLVGADIVQIWGGLLGGGRQHSKYDIWKNWSREFHFCRAVADMSPWKSNW